MIHHLPGVGKNLHDHLTTGLFFTLNDTNFKDLNWATALEYLLYRTGPLSSSGKGIILILLRFCTVNHLINKPNISHNCVCNIPILTNRVFMFSVSKKSILVFSMFHTYLANYILMLSIPILTNSVLVFSMFNVYFSKFHTYAKHV